MGNPGRWQLGAGGCAARGEPFARAVFVRGWLGQACVAGITACESKAKTAHDAALAGGIPSLKHDNRPLRAAEIGLLDELKNPTSDAARRRRSPVREIR